jgi:hypothetical protein
VLLLQSIHILFPQEQRADLALAMTGMAKWKLPPPQQKTPCLGHTAPRTSRVWYRWGPHTQFLCNPFGRWVFQDRAVGRGGTQPAAVGEGGHVGPEEFSALVSLGAAVLAACLSMGAAG